MEATLGCIKVNKGPISVSKLCIRKFMILVWFTIELSGSRSLSEMLLRALHF